MALSGTVTLSRSALDIITTGLSICGAVDVDQPLENIDLQTGLAALNNLVKFYQTQTLHLWKKTEGLVFLDVGKTDYKLGPAGDEACDFDDFVESTLSAAEASGQTVLSITSTTGMAASDVIGIKLDDGTRQWTTIASVDSSILVTVDDALTDDAASGATVYTFTNLIPRPTRILDDARFRQNKDASQIPVVRWSRQQYQQQTEKTSQGTVVNDYYSPQLGDGRYYLWQTASNVDSIVFFTYEAPIQVFDTTANNPDFPEEAYLPLAYGLAEAVMLEYKTPIERRADITRLADKYLNAWLGFDEEGSSINLQPHG